MLFPYLSVVVWLAVVYLPFAMRSWRAFLVLCAAYLLMHAGVLYGVATYTAAQVPAFLVAIGDFWLDLLVWVLPVPIIARATVLAARSLGLSGRRLFALNVVGILALPGTGLAILAHEHFDRRPAPAACTDRPLSLTLSGLPGSVPWSEAIALGVGPDVGTPLLFLPVPRHRRSICRETSDGTDPLTIRALEISPAQGRCEGSDTGRWAHSLCTEAEDPRAGVLPHRIVFFDPDGIRPGDFGIPGAATNGDFPRGDYWRLVSAANAETGTVTAVCQSRPHENHPTHCEMRRTIADGLDLFWSIAVPEDAVGDAVLEAEMRARRICSDVFGHPDCATPDGTLP